MLMGVASPDTAKGVEEDGETTLMESTLVSRPLVGNRSTPGEAVWGREENTCSERSMEFTKPGVASRAACRRLALKSCCASSGSTGGFLGAGRGASRGRELRGRESLPSPAVSLTVEAPHCVTCRLKPEEARAPRLLARALTGMDTATEGVLEVELTVLPVAPH
jgi:hypothetical protein